jgi:hypothetical protein
MFPVCRAHLIALISFILAILPTAETLRAQVLIPIQNGRDMVFDFSGQRLYISTSDGFVQRYNLSTGQLEAPFNLGGMLNAIDIARDNSFLLVAQQDVGVSQGTIHKVNTSTGAITNIDYPLQSGEGGVWDLAIGSNGLALVTTSFQGNFPPIRQIDLATNAISIRNDVPSFNGDFTSTIYRSADGTRFYFLQSERAIFTYSATTNTFGNRAPISDSPIGTAMNRNGTLVASIMNQIGASLDAVPNFNYVHNFSAADRSVAFDAQTDTIYLVNTSLHHIIAYDTVTYAAKLRLNITDQISSGSGTFVASPDGIHLALQTDSGIRLFDVRMGTPALPPTFGTPRDLVFDHAGQHLYITTAEGLLWPYNLSTNTLGIPFNVGGSPYGIDITANDSVLLIGQGFPGLTQGAFQKVDLATGAITSLGFQRSSFEFGSWDVAISSGFALGTTSVVKEINPVANTVADRGDAPVSGFGASLQVHRSADRRLLYFLQSSSGIVFTYSGPSNTFGPSVNTHTSLFGASAAVNRDGPLLGTRISNNGGASLETAANFNFIHTFNTFDTGIAFDAVQDTIYGVNSLRNQIIAYDTTTFAEKFRFDIGENVSPGQLFLGFGPGNLVASQDGHYVAVITATTFRVFGLPAVPLTSVVSRKAHGTAGTFDISLPLDSNPGIECRDGGPNREYTLVFTFGANLTSVGSATVTSVGGFGEATISGSMINPSNLKQYVVNLTGVTDGQYLQVTLSNVNVAGARTDNISQFMGVLIGDTTGNGSVNSGDVGQTKAQTGRTLTNTNFREDVNASGAISASDVSFVKFRSGNALPDFSDLLDQSTDQISRPSDQRSAFSVRR